MKVSQTGGEDLNNKLSLSTDFQLDLVPDLLTLAFVEASLTGLRHLDTSGIFFYPFPTSLFKICLFQGQMLHFCLNRK